MEELLLRCDVCGFLRKHVLVGPHWESDEYGREYRRMECCTCKAQRKLYGDELEEEPETNGDEDEPMV